MSTDRKMTQHEADMELLKHIRGATEELAKNVAEAFKRGYSVKWEGFNTETGVVTGFNVTKNVPVDLDKPEIMQ